MSLERACVNCERCYNLASIEIKNFPENYALRIYQDDQTYIIRNEAMRALEKVIDNTNREMAMLYHEKNEENPAVIAQKALQACSLCDYTSPKIVETVENLSNS